MKKFKIELEDNAKLDIKKAKKYYRNISNELKNKFIKEISESFNTLELNPFFALRYDKIRCLPIKNFPYIIHFETIEKNNTVKIYAVLNTSTLNENLNTF